MRSQQHRPKECGSTGHKSKRQDENLRRKERRKEKRENKVLPEEELENRRKYDRERKAKSRKNILLKASRQKKVGLQIKERNRKRKNNDSSPPRPLSTPRVRKHHEKLTVNFDSSKIRLKHSKVSKVTSVLSKVMAALSPTSKVRTLGSCLSPSTKNKFAENVSESGGIALDVFRDLAQRRDNISNCARQLILSKTSCSSRSLNWISLQKARSTSTSNILVHYKMSKSKSVKPPPETVRLVLDFYNKDNNSHMLPYKKLTRRVKDHTGTYHFFLQINFFF